MESNEKALLKIQERSKKTIVFITHSIDEALVLSSRLFVMSARPGRIRAVIPNNLPTPRHITVQFSPEYSALKSKVWELIESEVRRHGRESMPGQT